MKNFKNLIKYLKTTILSFILFTHSVYAYKPDTIEEAQSQIKEMINEFSNLILGLFASVLIFRTIMELKKMTAADSDDTVTVNSCKKKISINVYSFIAALIARIIILHISNKFGVES